MKKTILVFTPNTLNRNKTGYLRGCCKNLEDYKAFYLTDDNILPKCENNIGYIGRNFKSSKCRKDDCLFLNNHSNKISVNNEDEDYNVVEIIYDYNGFKNSDIISRESGNYGKHFKLLNEELRKSNSNGCTNGKQNFLSMIVITTIFLIDIVFKIVKVVKPLMSCSATFVHFEENVLNLRWFFKGIAKTRTLSPKNGNMLTAKLIDLLIGIILLNWCLKHENFIFNFIRTSIEDIITNLRSLLLYLMGSPIGLKLNHSFNNMLGKFFFYHISLWRVFLQGMMPLLIIYFKYLVLPGALGFSFQIAMLSDIISIATFHVYCIYVYAARLFSLQIRGLTSLWRLFIGKKLNPLRQRVDSCKYTPDQLFIGTLGFTILLFLLPTTTMYYTVFSIFRLAILLVNGLLLRLRFLLNTLPLYVLVLWIFNSSSVGGTVYIDVKNDDDSEKVIIEAKLIALPLTSSIKKFIPDSVKHIKGKSFGYFLHSIFTGVLL